MDNNTNSINDEEFLVLHEFFSSAKSKLSIETWDYLFGGAETETTYKRNRLALNSLGFRPRILRNVEHLDTTVELFEHSLRIPVILAPIGSMQDFVESAGIAPTRAAARFGILHMLSSSCSPGLEKVARSIEYPKIFQLYVRGDKNWVDDHIRMAIQEGYIAFCFTVDLDAYGRRERDLAKRYRSTARRTATGPEHQMRFSWDDVKRIKDTFDIPLIIKGIATVEDAEMAVVNGIEAVYVSNHGGRQLDHGLGGASLLPEIVSAIKGKAKIIFDGGIMRGTDVIKGIALGADAVGIGRLQGLAAGANGEPGIFRMLEILETEIQICLRLLGVNRLSDLNSSYLRECEPLGENDHLSAFPLIKEGY